jgi:chemotaxis protein methyltransferase CheR
MIAESDLEDILHHVYEISGYDFHEYSRASLVRRITRLMDLDGMKATAELSDRLTADNAYMRRFVEEVTVNVTEMFRDPPFFRALATEVVPDLLKRPFIRIWHAGCSTGEEMYSMAILLHEAGALEKCRLYGTDLNPRALEQARAGVFSLEFMRQYSRNYLLSGGLRDFSNYYTAGDTHARFRKFLSQQMVFSTHNLANDSSFNQFDLVICRNVLIYFNRKLQERVFTLFDESLVTGGFIALGSRETLRFSPVFRNYAHIGKDKIWKKVRS